MKKSILFIFSISIIFACKKSNNQDEKANEIIEKCISAHGGTSYDDLNVSFVFRKYTVHLIQNNKEFQYTRTTTDTSNNSITDILTNKNFIRKTNNKTVELTAKEKNSFKESMNSIAYFALLPHKLQEPAVIAKYIGSKEINGQMYEKINVSFRKEGGGKDHNDVFCYWINQKTFTLDYLSYDNEGPRFRKAFNRQKINGVVFQDYENYQIADTLAATSEYDKIFIGGNAKLLSKIEQKEYKSLK